MFLDQAKPYFVAELNSSHRGKIELAWQMIDAAKACGCDAVKFQSWTVDSLYCGTYYQRNPMAKRMVKGFSLAPEALRELADYARAKQIDFSSTPYSKAEVDFLVDECQAPYIKVASMDINNVPFLRYIAGKRKPVVLSTGMADLEEVKRAVAVLEESGAEEICILHCVSIYPASPEQVNLRNMLQFQEAFPECRVGYSDHTLGIGAACAATALGAAMIEKHFTLDRSKIGWDNQMATEPEEMTRLVQACREAAQSLGAYERQVSSEEIAQRQKMRRSLVAAVNLKNGHVLRAEDLTAKRPGDGIPVSAFDQVIGRKVVRDIAADEMLLSEDIE